MWMSTFCTAVLTYVVIGHAPPAAAQVDQQRAQEYFKEAQALCERDGGRLWGVSLCAPLVIADQSTHACHEPTGAGCTLATSARARQRADRVGRDDVGVAQLGFCRWPSNTTS